MRYACFFEENLNYLRSETVENPEEEVTKISLARERATHESSQRFTIKLFWLRLLMPDSGSRTQWLNLNSCWTWTLRSVTSSDTLFSLGSCLSEPPHPPTASLPQPLSLFLILLLAQPLHTSIFDLLGQHSLRCLPALQAGWWHSQKCLAFADGIFLRSGFEC